MLNLTAARQAAGQKWPGALPLPLSFSCFSSDYPRPLLPSHPFCSLPHHTHLILQQHAESALPDAIINRLLLPRLPASRSGSSSRAPRPLTSFCIKDILGRDSTAHSQEFRSPSRRSDVSSTSSCRSLEALTSSANSSTRDTLSRSSLLSSKSRSLSMSPPTPTSVSRCSTPNEQSTLTSEGFRIVRPWIPDHSNPRVRATSADGIEDSSMEEEDEEEEEEEEEEEINVDDEEPSPRPERKGEGGGSHDVSPLDALMALTSKTLTGMYSTHCAVSRRQEQEAVYFSRHGSLKKRRKSRTAFSNQQIYQLEKRFLHQKYLTPSDRDDIAHTLGLSNAQVITWFQNRRAKLKRDLEELKNDVTAAKKHSVPRASSHPDRPSHTKHHRHHHHRHSLHKPTKQTQGGKDHRKRTPTLPIAASSSSSDPRPSSSGLISGACAKQCSSVEGGLGCKNNPGVSVDKMHNHDNVNDSLGDSSVFCSEDLDSSSSCDDLVVDDDYDGDDDNVGSGSLCDQHYTSRMESEGDSSERTSSSSGTESLPGSSSRRPFHSVASAARSLERQDRSEEMGEHGVYRGHEDDVDVVTEPENLSFKSPNT